MPRMQKVATSTLTSVYTWDCAGEFGRIGNLRNVLRHLTATIEGFWNVRTERVFDGVVGDAKTQEELNREPPIHALLPRWQVRKLYAYAGLSHIREQVLPLERITAQASKTLRFLVCAFTQGCAAEKGVSCGPNVSHRSVYFTCGSRYSRARLPLGWRTCIE